MIGKYVGARGSNISEVRQSCQDAVKSLSEETVRISIDPDKFINMKYVDKFFYIKNDLKTDDSVLITVSMKYHGNSDIFFRAIKNIMIKSVIDMFKPKKQEWYGDVLNDEDDLEIDVLGGGGGGTITIVDADEYNEDDDECFDPGSPHYSPSSTKD